MNESLDELEIVFGVEVEKSIFWVGFFGYSTFLGCFIKLRYYATITWFSISPLEFSCENAMLCCGGGRVIETHQNFIHTHNIKSLCASLHQRDQAEIEDANTPCPDQYPERLY